MSVDTISSVAATPPSQITGKTLSDVLPGFMVSVSSGATLTYNIEATGDTPGTGGNNSNNWRWVPMTGFTALTASIDGTLTGLPTYLRARITAYTSGSLTFMVTQPSAK